MVYHVFSNLREQLQSDLCRKLNRAVGSLDFNNLPCNCNVWTRFHDKYPYNKLCRHSRVMYKATCKKSGRFYISCTQQKLKSRMTQHFNETKDLTNKGITSDSFTKHFTTQYNAVDKVIVKQIRDFIIEKLINSCNEAYSVCRYQSKFHRYTNYTTRADEGQTGQKRIKISMTSNPTKRGRGRLRKIRFVKNNISTNIFADNTPPQISPISTNGQVFEFQTDVIEVLNCG